MGKTHFFKIDVAECCWTARCQRSHGSKIWKWSNQKYQPWNYIQTIRNSKLYPIISDGMGRNISSCFPRFWWVSNKQSRKKIIIEYRGTSYPCKKNPRIPRSKILKSMKVNDRVLIEKYTYRGWPSYLVVDPSSKCDLGVLGQGAADYLNAKYPNNVFIATLSDRHNTSFHVLPRSNASQNKPIDTHCI